MPQNSAIRKIVLFLSPAFGGAFYENLFMKNFVSLVCIVFFMVACNKEKKIIVMSKGEAMINTETKTIKAKDGAGHEEKMAVVSGDKFMFNLSTPAGEATVELLENGLYIINVKNDTIIGSYQKYSDPKLAANMMTQEILKLKIDSLQLLSEGKNVTAANRNFYILPNKAVKISDNMGSLVVGPYHQMRSAEKIDGKDPEVYRFYSIKEIREMIGRLQKLTLQPNSPTP